MADDVPRALDVTKFAAARQPEIHAMCAALQHPASKHKFGVEALPRQLRRRAASHNPYRHRKRPNTKLNKLHCPIATQAVNNQAAGQVQEPRPTNRAMRRRPAHLQATHELSCCQDPFAPQGHPPSTPSTPPLVPCSSHAHDLPHPMLTPPAPATGDQLSQQVKTETIIAPTPLVTDQQASDSQTPGLDQATASKHGMTTAQLPLHAQAAASKALSDAPFAAKKRKPEQAGSQEQPCKRAKVADSSFAPVLRQRSQGRGKDRSLETHLWHAKRMHMVHRWGHVLAEGAFGKGHGSRAFLHALRHSFVMHDASYLCPIELSGPCAAVCAVLQQVSAPDQARAVASKALPWTSGAEVPFLLCHPAGKPKYKSPALAQTGTEAKSEGAARNSGSGNDPQRSPEYNRSASAQVVSETKGQGAAGSSGVSNTPQRNPECNSSASVLAGTETKSEGAAGRSGVSSGVSNTSQMQHHAETPPLHGKKPPSDSRTPLFGSRTPLLDSRGHLEQPLCREAPQQLIAPVTLLCLGREQDKAAAAAAAAATGKADSADHIATAAGAIGKVDRGGQAATGRAETADRVATAERAVSKTAEGSAATDQVATAQGDVGKVGRGGSAATSKADSAHPIATAEGAVGKLDRGSQAAPAEETSAGATAAEGTPAGARRVSAAAIAGSEAPEKGCAERERLTILMWVHAAVVAEACQVVKAAADADGVNCRSRAPDLRRLELRGPGSQAALSHVLQASVTAKHQSRAPGLALGLVASDPRLAPVLQGPNQPAPAPTQSGEGKNPQSYRGQINPPLPPCKQVRGDTVFIGINLTMDSMYNSIQHEL